MTVKSNEIYRTAVIGCGDRAHAHGSALLAESRLRVVALADILPEAAAKYNAKFDFGAKIYTDYCEMLAGERPEIVVAPLWPALRVPVIGDCIRAGVRLIISEKPVAATWGECQEIGRMADESGVLLTFGHQRRFSRGNLQARQWIDEGKFGRIERMDLFSPRHLLDCGTHTIDQAFSFNHESPVKWVHGAVDIRETFAYFGVRAEIMATGRIEYANGVHATLQVGGPDREMDIGVRIIGSAGYLEVSWDGGFKGGRIYADPTWTPPTEQSDGSEQMLGVVRNAVDCLETGAEPELSYRRAIRSSEVLFALYESARTHQRIELPLNGVAGHPLEVILSASPGL